MKVKDCMCNSVAYVAPNCSIKDCSKVMLQNHVGCIPVCDNQNQIVGLVTDRDLILRCIACDKDTANTPVSEVMTSKVCCCNPETDIESAEEMMSKHQVRRLPVVQNGQIVGMITLGDLSKNQNVNTKSVCETLENICGCNEQNAE